MIHARGPSVNVHGTFSNKPLKQDRRVDYSVNWEISLEFFIKDIKIRIEKH
jgi:hypothetical protein